MVITLRVDAIEESLTSNTGIVLQTCRIPSVYTPACNLPTNNKARLSKQPTRHGQRSKCIRMVWPPRSSHIHSRLAHTYIDSQARNRLVFLHHSFSNNFSYFDCVLIVIALSSPSIVLYLSTARSYIGLASV